MNEVELKELLKLIRQVEHFIERCLRDERIKNEEKIRKHLEAQGVRVTDDSEKYFDEWASASESLSKTEVSEFEF